MRRASAEVGQYVQVAGVLEERRTFAGRKFMPPQGAYLRLVGSSRFVVGHQIVDELFLPGWSDGRQEDEVVLVGRLDEADTELGFKVHLLREARRLSP